MIKNERQFRITRAQAEKFRQAIADLLATPDERIDPILRRAEIEGLGSQLADLEGELREYEALKSGKRRIVEISSFEELPRALIQARIASGLTQRELAKRLGIKEQQVQRYEATDYKSASLSRVSEVIRALGIELGPPSISV